MNREKRANGTGRVFRRKRSRFLWLQYYSQNGEQIRVSSGTDDEKKAEKKLRGLIGEVAAGVHADTRRLTYESMRDAFYMDQQVNKRKSLRRDRNGKPYLDKVARLDSFFSGYVAGDITTDLLRKFIANEQARGLETSTINRSLSALRRMFNLCRQEGKLRHVPYFPMLKEPNPREGFLERADYEALSRSLAAHLRVPLALGYFTAARYSEILSLRWADVDFLGNVIALHKTKNDIPRTVPICAELRALLVEQRAKRQECQFVCYKLDQKGRAVRIQSFRKSWYAACVKAGLGHFEPKIDQATGKPVLARHVGHDRNPRWPSSTSARFFMT